MTPVRIGILGCGKVSYMYAPVLSRIAELEIVAVADVVTENATALVEAFDDLPPPTEPEALLADSEVEVVVNLTPISVHVEVTKAALTAGKHVYSEKPLASTLAEATELVELAEHHDLRLACAPDTLLGTGFQIARDAFTAGIVGDPLAASGLMFRSALPQGSWYGESATPFFDMGPYYVSALVNLFGPVAKVSGGCRMRTGTEPSDVRPTIAGTLEFASGMVAELVLAWGTNHRHEVPVLTVHGTDGVLRFPNPNNFGDPAFVRRYDESEWTELDGSGQQPAHWPRNQRGLGVGELALAIREQREPRTSARIGRHTVEVIEGLVRSGATGERVELTTTCQPAAPFPASTREALLG